MKTLKLFLAFAFVAVATSVSASQIVENQSAVPAADTNNGWDRVFVSYNASSLKGDGASVSFPGFSLGYMKGFSVSKNLPLFVEAGAALQFRTHKDEEDYGGYDITEKMNFFSLNIPVNCVYKWNINEDFSIDPFVGIDLRLNLTGKYKVTEDGESESINMFSKDAFGSWL